jgi:hypothetical protein
MIYYLFQLFVHDFVVGHACVDAKKKNVGMSMSNNKW